jgi:hypothetical protein
VLISKYAPLLYACLQLSLLAYNFQTGSEEWPGSNIEKFNRLTDKQIRDINVEHREKALMSKNERKQQ